MGLERCQEPHTHSSAWWNQTCLVKLAQCLIHTHTNANTQHMGETKETQGYNLSREPGVVGVCVCACACVCVCVSVYSCISVYVINQLNIWCMLLNVHIMLWPKQNWWFHSDDWHFSFFFSLPFSLLLSSLLSSCRLCLFWELIQQPTADQADRGVEQGERVHACEVLTSSMEAASVLTPTVSFCSLGSFVLISSKVGDDIERRSL